jgi:hypothetical protein
MPKRKDSRMSHATKGFFGPASRKRRSRGDGSTPCFSMEEWRKSGRQKPIIRVNGRVVEREPKPTKEASRGRQDDAERGHRSTKADRPPRPVACETGYSGPAAVQPADPPPPPEPWHYEVPPWEERPQCTDPAPATAASGTPCLWPSKPPADLEDLVACSTGPRIWTLIAIKT